jgi:voltage-gated potassium channel
LAREPNIEKLEVIMNVSGKFAALRKYLINVLAKLDLFLMLLGFAYLGIYSVEVLSSPPADIALALEIAGWAIYGVFLVDLAGRIFVWLPQFREFSGWIGFLKENWLAVLAAALPAFRSFRVLRVLVVLRGIYPYVQSRMAKVGVMVGVALPLIIYTSSLAVLEAERGSSDSLINSFGDALWWSMVTITTVGYGDTFPVTQDGRFVGTFLIFTGIGLFSVEPRGIEPLTSCLQSRRSTN